MTPAARLAAAAQVLDRIGAGGKPAEAVLKAWGAENRYAGSGDRRAVAERVYAVLRSRARLALAMDRDDGRALVIGSLALLDGLSIDEIEALHSGEGYGPQPLSKAERARITTPEPEPTVQVQAGLPEFVIEDFKATFGDRWEDEAKALTAQRAPVDLRVNGGKTSVGRAEAELRQAGLTPSRTPLSAWGLRLPSDPAPNVQALDAYKEGRIEIQDEASQLVSWLAGPRNGQTVIDYCAGGGGKTLALLQSMQLWARAHQTGEDVGGWAPKTGAHAGTAEPTTERPMRRVRLIACDVSEKRLDAIGPRLERAGVDAVARKLGPKGQGVDDLEGRAHVVLVDAPCSGSGAWRRRPEDIWRLKPAEVDKLHRQQVEIMDRAARLVRPRGRLVYVTCSMLRAENEATADAFEAAHPEFRPVPIAEAVSAEGFTDAGRSRLTDLAAGSHRLRLSPATSNTDGFFAALYERLP